GRYDRIAAVCRLPDTAVDRGQNVILRRVVYVLCGIEPESVEMIFAYPVSGILEDELTDWSGLLAVVVDCRAPVSFVLVREIVLGEFGQVVSVGSKMIVHDIEYHSDSKRMSAIDESAEVIRFSIKTCGRVQVDAVVTPAEPAGEVGYRHRLDDRYADPGKLI